jgi:hypothetical protein
MRYLIFVVTFCLAGCATLIHGSDESIEVTSTPSGASVEVNGRPVGETPTTAILERGKSYTVKIYRDGYEPHTATLRNGRSLWISLNIFNLMLPGLLVDASTGAFYSLEPDQISAELDSLGIRDSVGTRPEGRR